MGGTAKAPVRANGRGEITALTRDREQISGQCLKELRSGFVPAVLTVKSRRVMLLYRKCWATVARD